MDDQRAEAMTSSAQATARDADRAGAAAPPSLVVWATD